MTSIEDNKTDTKISSNLNGPHGDDIASLFDSVPVLDSLFHITKKIGYGTFSSVYLGHLKKKNDVNNKRKFAIKHIIPTSHPSRIYMELKSLKMLGGKDNIIEVAFCLRNLNHIVLVMPYFPYDSFSDFVGNLSPEEVSDYILNLCLALRRVHSFNMVHRDVKPSNFLCSRKYRKYALIDFGLSQELNSSDSRTGKTPSKRNEVCARGSKRPNSGFAIGPVKKARLDLPLSECLNKTEEYCNELIRRSPRKLPSSLTQSFYKESPKENGRESCKENVPLVSSINEINNAVFSKASLDSPSKNTRLSSLLRPDDASSMSPRSNAGRSLSFTPAILRRSPRKSVRTGMETTLEKLTSMTTSYCESSIPASARSGGLGSSTIGASLTGQSCGTSRSFQSGTKGQIKPVETRTRSGWKVIRGGKCSCYGSSKVCSSCLGRRGEHAPRAGTPGFRAPEVLMRHPDQTSAIDMWSVGVILLCLLSGRYPFFRAVDDLASLMEITTVLGTRQMKKAAANLEKLLTVSEEVPALDLKKLCEKLRGKLRGEEQKSDTADMNTCKGCKQTALDCICSKQSNANSITSQTLPSVKEKVNQCQSGQENSVIPSTPEQEFPQSAYNLLSRLLEPNPDRRVTAEEALNHEFLTLFSK